MTSETRYPELEKLKAISDKSQVCGEFYDWLRDKGWTLCESHTHEECDRDKDGFGWDCGLSKDEYTPVQHPIRRLLAEFFEIDEKKLEDERREILESLRGTR